MSRTVLQQVKSGIGLAVGILVFIAGAGLTLSGLELVLAKATPLSLVWSPKGWVLLASSFVLLLAMAPYWYKFFAGCAILGFLKALFSIVTGRSVYSASEPVPRLAGFHVLVVCALVIWFAVRAEGTKLSIQDRVTLTLVWISLMWYLHGPQGSMLVEIPLSLAFVSLLAAGLRHGDHPGEPHSTVP